MNKLQCGWVLGYFSVVFCVLSTVFEIGLCGNEEYYLTTMLYIRLKKSFSHRCNQFDLWIQRYFTNGNEVLVHLTVKIYAASASGCS